MWKQKHDKKFPRLRTSSSTSFSLTSADHVTLSLRCRFACPHTPSQQQQQPIEEILKILNFNMKKKISFFPLSAPSESSLQRIFSRERAALRLIQHSIARAFGGMRYRRTTPRTRSRSSLSSPVERLKKANAKANAKASMCKQGYFSRVSHSLPTSPNERRCSLIYCKSFFFFSI